MLMQLYNRYYKKCEYIIKFCPKPQKYIYSSLVVVYDPRISRANANIL